MGSCNFIPETNQFFSFMDQETKKKGIPLSGTFELTPRCNFNCKMCYVHLLKDKIPQFGRELSKEEWIHLGEQARDAGMLQLCITGGEPLLHPDFIPIYKALSQMGFYITLQTNGYFISEAVMDVLKEFPPYLIKITLYGSNDAVYKDVCEIENGFSCVHENLMKLKEAKIPIFLVTTVIQQNMNDLMNILHYVQTYKFPWTYTSSIHPSVRGAETNLEQVMIDETMVTDFHQDIRNLIEHPAMTDEKKPCEYCKGYRNSFWITWNGKMRFCSFMNEPNISVLYQSFDSAWQELLQYEEALMWPIECQMCEIKDVCYRCVGSLASRSGSVHRVDPVFCEKMKRYIREEKEKMESEHEI